MELAERAYYRLCFVAGRILSGSRYSTVQIMHVAEVCEVHKRRRWYAGVLIAMGSLLVRVLGTGQRVLPKREWFERERRLYQQLYAKSVRIDEGDAIVLPCLPGPTLASLLTDASVDDTLRLQAIRLAAKALAALHDQGITHGDAMAENVLVDLELDVAHWFDFETVHDDHRVPEWCQGDDLRALLATILVRTAPNGHAASAAALLAAYPHDAPKRVLREMFRTPWRRALPFHLGQAPMSREHFRQIGRGL